MWTSPADTESLEDEDREPCPPAETSRARQVLPDHLAPKQTNKQTCVDQVERFLTDHLEQVTVDVSILAIKHQYLSITELLA